MGRLISDSRTTKRKQKSTSWYSEQKKRGAFQSNRAADPFSFFASSYGRIVHSGRYDAFLSRNNNLPTIRRRRGRQFAEASLRMSIESRNVHSQVPGIPPKKKSPLEIAAESENDPELIKLLNQLKEYERERRHETDGIFPTFPVIMRRRNALVPPVEECGSAEVSRSSSRFARSPSAADSDDDYINTQQQNAALASLTPEQWIGIISGPGAASGASWANSLNVGQSNANNENDDGTSDISSSDSSSDEDGDQMVRELHGLSYPSDDISEDDDSEEDSDSDNDSHIGEYEQGSDDDDDDSDDDDNTDGNEDSDDNLCTCITCIESRLNQSTYDNSDY
ncbi:hypothetical protein MIR68_008174 [Amoeboaphelidium protococcarum]|nr:hypothetical protein MIR68_008174 [Amoeboaphelidium protococcarum]